MKVGLRHGWRGRTRRAAVAAAVGSLALAACSPGGQRERALLDMRRSLRMVVRAADLHKTSTGSYETFMAPPGMAGVTVVVKDLSPGGFLATATHRYFDDLECEAGVGPARPQGVPEGVPGGSRCQ